LSFQVFKKKMSSNDQPKHPNQIFYHLIERLTKSNEMSTQRQYTKNVKFLRASVKLPKETPSISLASSYFRDTFESKKYVINTIEKLNIFH